MSRVSQWAFWLVMVGFLVASAVLASGNNSPGSTDSMGNLSLARNLVAGRGFVTIGVGSLWFAHPIPGEEVTRPPALPYLLAGLFKLFGEGLWIPVMVNAVAVACCALFLRSAVGRIVSGSSPVGWCRAERGPPSDQPEKMVGLAPLDTTLRDVAGILVLLSYDYEMVSIWNNNILASCNAALLYLATRRSSIRGLWVGFAVCSAFGFLMKPTFVLGAVPFVALVIGTDGSKSIRRRAVELAAFLGLLAALTSIYWGRNLRDHGELLYSPSFTNSRLALRYGVLGEGEWRTVRFDRPMTYREVIQKIGLLNMLIGDGKEVAKTAFYTICMNPAVALIAATLALFWRRDRWVDYAGPLLLMAAVGFEVGVYNHHEFRYLWPIYPAILALAAMAVRDFRDWGIDQMGEPLAGRARTLFGILGIACLMIGAMGSAMSWQAAFKAANQPKPGWVAAIKALPADAVVLSNEVAPIVWWADRKAVIAPIDSRHDLATVVSMYKVNYALETDAGLGKDVAFREDDLEPIGLGAGWVLYRIVLPIEK